jgi:Domain of Unknown Function with PDB structure (DUF3862)
MKTLLKVALFLVVCLIIFTLLNLLFSDRENDESELSSNVSATAELGKVSYKEYSEIREGMPTQDVKIFLGEPKDRSRITSGNKQVTTYIYDAEPAKDELSATLSLTFENNKLVGKSQEGME